jgi:hypothetical protein
VPPAVGLFVHLFFHKHVFPFLLLLFVVLVPSGYFFVSVLVVDFAAALAVLLRFATFHFIICENASYSHLLVLQLFAAFCCYLLFLVVLSF